MKYRNRSSRETVEGFAFSDFISTEQLGQTRHHEGDLQKTRAMRGYFMSVLLFFLIGILLSRLGFLTLFQGQYYRELSQNNRVRTTVIHAPRGIIFDRNDIPLVFNIPGFRQVEKTHSASFGSAQDKSSGQAKTAILSNEEATKALAMGAKNIEIDSLRQYPYTDAVAHVVGYIGQITEEELKESQFTNYRPGDLIGKSGIEQFYEDALRGVDGKQLVEVDVMGKDIRKLGEQDPISGKDITITIDAKLQEAAFLAMKDIKKGAVVVSNPKGEILSMVSKPSFDPNLFTLGKGYSATASNAAGASSAYKTIESVLLDGDGQPLLDRVISGVYPPGSTFKLVTAASALENKKIDENFTVTDTGILQVGTFSFGNWYYLQHGGKDGEVDVVKGIKRSNDIFFYKAAELLGVEKLSETASMFGLGKKTGIDLFGEASGTVPTDEWKRKVIGEQWYLGDTYHYGIGQGYLLATPLQVNTFTQAIVNEGKIYKPHLLQNNESIIMNNANLSKKNFDLIREGMIQSCAPGGVAWPLFELKTKNLKLKTDGKNFLEVPQSTMSAKFKDYRQIVVACKTGTAQHGGEQTLPHAWISLWAPAYDPQIIVTVLAESSGEGSSIAGPVAKKILEEWFSR